MILINEINFDSYESTQIIFISNNYPQLCKKNIK